MAAWPWKLPMGEDALKEGMVLSGTYRVVRLIGQGGMGEVYEALHQRTGSAFAVKVLAGSLGQDDTILERFRREAEVTSPAPAPEHRQGVRLRSAA